MELTDRLDIHLGIKNASRSLHNRNRLIESLNLVNSTSLTSDDRDQIESQILRMEIGCESIRQGLGLAGGDLNIVTSAGQVANNSSTWVSAFGEWLQGGESTANDSHLYSFWLVILEGEKSLCRVAVDELDTEDFRLWERGRDGDGEVRSWGVEIRLFGLLQLNLLIKIFKKGSCEK
jgi:hypothetical protein